MDFVFIFCGIALLSLGGEALIRGALGAANKYQVSPLMAGILIVGFGTSAPELAVSVDATLKGSQDIAIGNVVGSNIGNILLILGLCAIIRPLTIQRRALQRDATSALLSTLLCCLLISLGLLNLVGGLTLISGLCLYLLWVYITEKSEQIPSAVMHVNEAKEVQRYPTQWLSLIAFVIAGLAMMLSGSHFLLKGASSVAISLGISEATVGLTIVAVGTSFPELSISIIAVIRKHVDVAIGNVLGSNIFNILGILGIASVLDPLAPTSRIINYDMWAMLVCAIALLILLWSTKKIHRATGALMLTLYATYSWVGIQYY
ncbi:MAG: calcium/sodium antiporter [Aliiglaciecola sp.]